MNFEVIKQQLKDKGLASSSKSIFLFKLIINLLLGSDEIHRLISTASILFYFLYHSQKTKFPVDIDAIKQFISKARAELEGVSREKKYSIVYINYSFQLVLNEG